MLSVGLSRPVLCSLVFNFVFSLIIRLACSLASSVLPPKFACNLVFSVVFGFAGIVQIVFEKGGIELWGPKGFGGKDAN